MSIRDTIIEAAARALWVSAYMDHVEGDQVDETCPACLDGDRAAHCTHGGEDCPFGDPSHSRPGGGADWFDYAPPTGDAAYETARTLIAQIERNNQIAPGHPTRIGDLYELIADPDRPDYPEHRKKPDPGDFGHYLAMEALGHGVSWADDHAPHGLEIPHIEFYL